jgi:DNA-directed RNA polymerase specialized sigma24 family protein
VAEDDARLWELLRAVAKDGDAAWGPLLVALEPELAGFARRQPIGRLRDREDTPREIVTRVIARLHAREYAAVKKLVTQDPAPELRAWLRVLVRRSAIDYMRESPEFERGNANREHRWISLATLSSGAPAANPDSLAQKRREVLAFIQEAVEKAATEHAAHGEDALGSLSLLWKIPRIHVRRLVQKGQQYLQVLTNVLAGRSYPEVAELLGITRREVELTVRYIEELMKERRFS